MGHSSPFRVVASCSLLFAACMSPSPRVAGTLLLVGGGLDDDTRAVYTRLLTAPPGGAAHVVVATAATGPEEIEATDKSEALRTWAPNVAIDVVGRGTSTADSCAAFARATAVFFTGGDQKRITTRYRPGDQDSPELAALRAVLARGGLVGGGSAGCAMMGERMLLGGRNAQALGVPAPADDGGEPVPVGPRLGPGLGFLRGVLTDSHFFERERIGRLAAALLAGPDRLGLGVGEDAAVAIDVAAHTAHGITPSESLLVDGTFARRDGAVLSGFRARCIGQGDTVPLRPLGDEPPPPLPNTNATATATGATNANVATVRTIPVVEPGQNRQLASWRLFRQAAVPGAGVLLLPCDGFHVRAMPAGDGVTVVFEVVVGAVNAR